jgi:uncharacterized membrane protein
MTDATLDREPPLFAATLTPHRSMGRTGLAVVMALAIGFAAIPAVIFLMMGAWPVFGFLGLDLLLIYLAFHFSFKAARAYETVVLTPEALTIRHVTGTGKKREFVINPAWARLSVERHDDVVEDVIVSTRDKAVAIGRFLPPEEKASFAAAFGPALARVSQLVR